MPRLLAVYKDSGIMRFEYSDARMPFAMAMGGTTYFLAYDQVSSLRVVADASGVAVKKIEYDSFGNIITETNLTMKIPFGFAGGLHDRDTGLVRFGYRDYDPDTDLYGYCVNDPVNGIDLNGLETITSEQGQKVIEAAESWIGTPYQYGGNSSMGTDCSHLVHRAYEEAGLPYPYTQSKRFPPEDFEEVTSPRDGDVMKWDSGHLGIYDQGNCISVTRTGGVVRHPPSWIKGTTDARGNHDNLSLSQAGHFLYLYMRGIIAEHYIGR